MDQPLETSPASLILPVQAFNYEFHETFGDASICQWSLVGRVETLGVRVSCTEGCITGQNSDDVILPAHVMHYHHIQDQIDETAEDLLGRMNELLNNVNHVAAACLHIPSGCNGLIDELSVLYQYIFSPHQAVRAALCFDVQQRRLSRAYADLCQAVPEAQEFWSFESYCELAFACLKDCLS